MKVLMINGSPHKDGTTARALHEISEALKKHDITTSVEHIGTAAIRGCIACGKCAQSGYCIFNDDMVNKCIDALKEADGFIVGSPVYYAGPNASLCALLDRMFFMKSAPFAFKPAASVVVCRRGGASSSFDRLNKYFTIAQMPVVSSQYWNSVHGNNSTADAEKDLEGLQIMRTLANNMAWLLKCIKAAEGKVPFPQREPWVATNFIS